MGIFITRNKNIIFLVIGGISLYIILTVPFLNRMPITVDEIQFAEPAYNFINHGHFGTTSLSGLFGFDEKTYWQHPLYLALMYIPIKLFGYSFWSIKIMSVIIGLITLVYAYKIGKETGVPHLFPAMMTLNCLFICMSKIGRMEALTMCLALATFYYCLEKKYLVAGLISSLAILTHPIGLFTALNAVIIIGYRRKVEVRYFMGLLLPLMLASIPIIVDFHEFHKQYVVVQTYLYDARGLLSFESQIKNFINLCQRADIWLKLQVPIFALFIWGFFQKKDEIQKIIIAILAVNFIGLVLAVPNKYINYYTALVLPYTLLFVAIAVIRYRKVFSMIILIVALLANGIMVAKVTAVFAENESEIIKLRMMLRPKARILGPAALKVPLEDREVYGLHVVKIIMDLEHKTVDEALAELRPEYIIVDSSIAGEQNWRLFTSSEDEFSTFIKERTVYRGKAQFNGDMLYIFEFVPHS